MLEKCLRPKIKAYENNDNFWCKKYGATSHTAHRSLAILQEMFPGHLIGKILQEDIAWPPRSTNLSTCDYFLWGYFKSEFFKCRPRTIKELQKAIRQEIERILHKMLVRVLEKF
jgi:hypothetical protein